jgi:putative dimethyl sulfoxide reductase chaperone
MEIDAHNHNILKGYNMLLYFAGSMIMFEPSEECIVDFWENGILKRLPVSSSNPNFVKAASQLRDSFNHHTTNGKTIREDYVRLLKGEMSLAPAYESLYIRKSGFRPGQYSDNVTEFYNSYGWVSKFKGRIKDDHLGIEILFLTILIDKYLVFDDNACQTEMKKEIIRFLENHILSWIGEWNEKIQANSNTLCFKAIGTLLLACSEDLFNVFTQNHPVSFVNEGSRN